jgi:hypothetical protein
VVVTAGEASAVVAEVGVAPADHVYETAPDAVIVAVSPSHMVAELALTTGTELTVTVEIAVPVQPASVPVTVYVVVVAGAALALDTPMLVAPADQVYEPAPEAFRVAV